MRTAVRMFQEAFVPQILSGGKKTTIRPRGKAPIQPGTLIRCRYWEGRPYNSRQKDFAEVKIVEAFDVEIHPDLLVAIDEDGTRFESSDQEQMEKFALADGFASWTDLVSWFRLTYRVPWKNQPFEGRLIRWKEVVAL